MVDERPPKRKKVEDAEPTQEERAYLVNELKQSEDQFHPLDFREIMHNEHFLNRYWFHAFYMPGDDQLKDALELALLSLRWREEFGVRSVTEDDLDQGDKDSGGLYARNRDKDGKRLLIFCVRNHFKDSAKTLARKKFLIYHLEKLQKEEKGDQITIMFDCEKGSIRNFDLELIQFFIQVMLHYYPHMVNMILVFEMPWVLNAGWKIIKPLLPGPAVKKIKFVTRSSLSEFVDPSNQLSIWGGDDPWQYIWEPNKTLTALTSGEEESEDMTMMVVTPEKYLNFTMTDNSIQTNIHISNISAQLIVYKIKTTSPEIFRVQPHTAFVPPNETKAVRIFVSSSSGFRNIHNEKFQILSTMVTTPGMPARETFLKGESYQEVRLYCKTNVEKELEMQQHLTQDAESVGDVSSAQLLRKLHLLDDALTRCQNKVSFQNKFFTLAMFCYVALLALFLYRL